MALPTGNVDEAIDATSSSGPTSPSQAPTGLVGVSLPSARTAWVTQKYNSTANVTCNLATDTILYRADGSIWDDTQQCWLNADKLGASGSPRN